MYFIKSRTYNRWTKSFVFEIEDEQINIQIQKLESSKLANKSNNKKVAPQKETIEYDDFAKQDIRIGTILEAEIVPKTSKLLKLKIDTGVDTRTVVSGIAEYYKPEEVIGKQVCILINLAPRKLRGIESQGMILMAEDNSGKLLFVSPEAKMNNGGEVR